MAVPGPGSYLDLEPVQTCAMRGTQVAGLKATATPAFSPTFTLYTP